MHYSTRPRCAEQLSQSKDLGKDDVRDAVSRSVSHKEWDRGDYCLQMRTEVSHGSKEEKRERTNEGWAT
jgi:hypothetical protein